MSIFSDLFGWIGKLFTKIWRAFKAVLPYLLIACALWVGLVGPLSLAWLGIATPIAEGWMSALFFMGTSYLLAPEETTEVVSGVSSSVGDSLEHVAEDMGDVGSAVGDAVGSTLSSFLSSSGLLWVAVAVGAYFLLSGDKKDSKNVAASTKSPSKTGTKKVGSIAANASSYGTKQNGGGVNNAVGNK